MKKLLIIPILFFVKTLHSQVGAKAPLVDVNKIVYSNAIKANDVGTAIIAANYMVAANAKSSYRDSLAILHLSNNNLQSAYFWSSNVLATKPTDPLMLEIKAISLKNGNNALEAIDAYSALLKVKPNALNGYELMLLQFNIKRLAECALTGYNALKMPLDSNIYVKYAPNQKEVLQTPLKAAILNLLGIAHNELNQFQDAKLALEAALKVDSKYVFALQNLEAVNITLLAKQQNSKIDKVSKVVDNATTKEKSN